MNRRLHLVAFDNPWPPDYGGAIDIFYKIKHLAEAGIDIRLHLFTYGRNNPEPLKKWCEELHIYPRDLHPKHFFSMKPFIVQTRQNKKLLENLSKDSAPVLFEGIHTTAPAYKLAGQKKIFLRAHNRETAYYKGLARSEKNPFRQFYFYSEYLKLKIYERKTLPLFDEIFCVNKAEKKEFEKYNPKVTWLPVFHPFDNIKNITPEENWVLYHGNLSVPENINAVIYLWENVMKDLPYPFYVSGKNPSKHIRQLALENEKFHLIPNPNFDQLMELMEKAKIHLFYTRQNTGIKLKLIYALYHDKHIVCNDKTVKNSGLEPLVYIENSPGNMKQRIELLMQSENDKPSPTKKEILTDLYNNHSNAMKIIKYVFRS